jgi:uncharacterized membrane protein
METAEETNVHYLAESGGADSIDIRTAKFHRTTVALQAQSFSGPMPSPDHLEQYDRVVPDTARLIVDEFRLNARHAREVESTGLRGSIQKDTRAQCIAGFLVLIGFGLVYGLAEHHHDGVAIAVAVTLLVSVLTAFLTGTVLTRGNESRGNSVRMEEDAIAGR